MTTLELFAEILRASASRCEACQGTGKYWYLSAPDSPEWEPCDVCFDCHYARQQQTYATLEFDDFEIMLDAMERAKEEANR